ncbi:cucumisin [Lathyrus oleraceus]|uniref:cucumisin n=1 Tax=Pisum sativum TaxID=3888 RepID=UPI0021D05D48|nr:cucumisin-like [Pisum sativum]
MAGLEGVVSVLLNQKRHILTTKSWDFIGLTQYAERENYKSDIILGVIVTGIWPESSSFNNEGFGPLPTKWNGSCIASNFSCNRKIIGAKYYLSSSNEPLSQVDFESPRDSKGHGTHTSSTAAGNPVIMASMLGLAQGTTRGVVPSARIAVYKVCWSTGCFDESILAAFDDAILDGVDILSVSLGYDSADNNNHYKDAISIGAFHAMRDGVLTVVAGGNLGPHPASLHNLAPWTIIISASTIDRKFITKVKLGDNTTYEIYIVITGPYFENIMRQYIELIHQAANRLGSRVCYRLSLEDFEWICRKADQKRIKKNELEGVVCLLADTKRYSLVTRDDEISLAWKENLSYIFYL